MFEQQIMELEGLLAKTTTDITLATEMITTKKAEVLKIKKAIATFKSLIPTTQIVETIDPLFAPPMPPAEPVMSEADRYAFAMGNFGHPPMPEFITPPTPPDNEFEPVPDNHPVYVDDGDRHTHTIGTLNANDIF